MRTATVAGVFARDTHPAPGDPTIVDLGEGDYVDCSTIFPVPSNRLGELWTPALSAEELALVTAGVRTHLCIDQLLAEEPEPIFDTDEWVPRQGMVRKVEWPAGDFHMFGVLSAAESNAKLGTSTGVLLTSKRKSSAASGKFRWPAAVARWWATC